MHTFEIHTTGEKYSFPSCQEEMNQRQRIAFVSAIMLYKTGTINITILRQVILKHLLDIRPSQRFKYFLPKKQKLKAGENFARLAELLDSLFEITTENGKKVYTTNLEIPIQFIPVLKHKRRKYYGPETAFTDLSFYEFRMASYYYSEYINKGSESFLDLLIALLYRPQKRFYAITKHKKTFNGIRRSDISANTNPNYIEARAKKLSSLSFATKYTILLYAAGCFAYLRTGNPEIDGKEISFERLYKNESQGESIGLSGLLFNMAESKIFGDIDKTDSQNIYTIFSRMYQLMLQDEELKRKQKKDAKN